jgi:hypothetical protein
MGDMYSTDESRNPPTRSVAHSRTVMRVSVPRRNLNVEVRYTGDPTESGTTDSKQKVSAFPSSGCLRQPQNRIRANPVWGR